MTCKRSTKRIKRQLQSLIVSAPEHLRERFTGMTTHAIVTSASKLRINASWDLESRVTAQALRAVAQRSQHLQNEAATHERQIMTIVRDWRPDLLDQRGVDQSLPPTCCAPGRIKDAAETKQPSPASAAPHQSLHHQG
jgi:hypothetical protein